MSDMEGQCECIFCMKTTPKPESIYLGEDSEVAHDLILNFSKENVEEIILKRNREVSPPPHQS
jgi:hypothetical protein